MNDLTQIERAKKVADNFQPTEPSEGCYAYVFLGKATWDASSYELIDGQYLMSRRVWHVDESKTDFVSYAGRGRNGRINDSRRHSVSPSSALRIKLRSDLSYRDSVQLERLLIEELGCICDAERSDGCLVNLRLYEGGPLCCSSLEAAAYKLAKTQEELSVERIAMTEDKTIVSRGSASRLSRELGISRSQITECSRNRRRGIWQTSHRRALYFCYSCEYETYAIRPMTNKQMNKERVLVVASIDGSDIFCGTGSEVAAYAPECKYPAQLHDVAQGRGRRKTIVGFVARYADEPTDEPLSSEVPNLNAFF